MRSQPKNLAELALKIDLSQGPKTEKITLYMTSTNLGTCFLIAIQEAQQQKDKIEKMKTEGEDEYKVKKMQEVGNPFQIVC